MYQGFPNKKGKLNIKQMKQNENIGKKRNNKRSKKGKEKAFPNAKLVYQGFLTWGIRRTIKYPKMKTEN